MWIRNWPQGIIRRVSKFRQQRKRITSSLPQKSSFILTVKEEKEQNDRPIQIRPNGSFLHARSTHVYCNGVWRPQATRGRRQRRFSLPGISLIPPFSRRCHQQPHVQTVQEGKSPKTTQYPLHDSHGQRTYECISLEPRLEFVRSKDTNAKDRVVEFYRILPAQSSVPNLRGTFQVI